jgi:hypothetical protein
MEDLFDFVKKIKSTDVSIHNKSKYKNVTFGEYGDCPNPCDSSDCDCDKDS